jgi:hypothetical protein
VVVVVVVVAEEVRLATSFGVRLYSTVLCVKSKQKRWRMGVAVPYFSFRRKFSFTTESREIDEGVDE